MNVWEPRCSEGQPLSVSALFTLSVDPHFRVTASICGKLVNSFKPASFDAGQGNICSRFVSFFAKSTFKKYASVKHLCLHERCPAELLNCTHRVTVLLGRESGGSTCSSPMLLQTTFRSDGGLFPPPLDRSSDVLQAGCCAAEPPSSSGSKNNNCGLIFKVSTAAAPSPEGGKRRSSAGLAWRLQAGGRRNLSVLFGSSDPSSSISLNPTEGPPLFGKRLIYNSQSTVVRTFIH